MIAKSEISYHKEKITIRKNLIEAIKADIKIGIKIMQKKKKKR